MEYLQYVLMCIYLLKDPFVVLNLIINGIPSIPSKCYIRNFTSPFKVLNLIINGIPSILIQNATAIGFGIGFVLNLIINGIPSIPTSWEEVEKIYDKF